MMNARTTILLIVAVFAGAPIQAAPIEMVFPAPTYTAGSPLLFTVILPTNIQNLGAYEIQISIAGTSVAGVDYGFDLGAIEASPTKYMFDSDNLFFTTLVPSSATTQQLLLTDLMLAGGVDVRKDENDHVADITVFTSPDYSGPLTFTIDAQSLILDQPNGSEIEQITTIRQEIADAGTITIVVPEPRAAAGWVIATCLAIGFGMARQRRRSPSRLGNAI